MRTSSPSVRAGSRHARAVRPRAWAVRSLSADGKGVLVERVVGLAFVKEEGCGITFEAQTIGILKARKAACVHEFRGRVPDLLDPNRRVFVGVVGPHLKVGRPSGGDRG